MSLFWQALLAAQRVTPAGPLRTLYFDDQDLAFFTYTGTWHVYMGGWAGGITNNTMTYRQAVVPSEPTPIFDTPIIRFRGTPAEGIDFLGSSETGGPLVFFMRALDSKTNSGWVQFGPPIATYCYRYEWANNGRDKEPEVLANYYNSFQGQNNYDHLGYPGLIQLRGLPDGRYQFRMQKPANTTDPNDAGNRATYFDGATVYTCHPTLS